MDVFRRVVRGNQHEEEEEHDRKADKREYEEEGGTVEEGEEAACEDKGRVEGVRLDDCGRLETSFSFWPVKRHTPPPEQPTSEPVSGGHRAPHPLPVQQQAVRPQEEETRNHDGHIQEQAKQHPRWGSKQGAQTR